MARLPQFKYLPGSAHAGELTAPLQWAPAGGEWRGNGKEGWAGQINGKGNGIERGKGAGEKKTVHFCDAND